MCEVRRMWGRWQAGTYVHTEVGENEALSGQRNRQPEKKRPNVSYDYLPADSALEKAFAVFKGKE